MLVKFGICINDMGIDTRMFDADDTYEKLEFYVLSKLNYCLNRCDELYLRGVRHVRLPNLLPPSYKQQDFNQLLIKLKTIDKFRLFKRMQVTYSFHLPYTLGTKNIHDRSQLKRYIININKLLNTLSIKKFSIVSHVKDNRVSKDNKILTMLDSMPYRYRNSIVIENDEYHSSIDECLSVSKLLKCPVVFDNLHNRLNDNSEINSKLFESICSTWFNNRNTIKMHYSSYSSGSNNGHGYEVNADELSKILTLYKPHCDEIIVMLEIKNSIMGLEELRYNTEDKWRWLDAMMVVI